MRRSGVRSPLLVLLVLTVAGCWYGFAGGGLPSHIRTVAVIPFENETASPEIQAELTEALRDGMQRWLGLRPASEDRADAVLRGTIRRYDADVPVGISADPRQTSSGQRRLEISVDLELVDQTTGRPLWERSGLVADGTYGEAGEAEGRREAIEEIVNSLVQGAQSQW